MLIVKLRVDTVLFFQKQLKLILPKMNFVDEAIPPPPLDSQANSEAGELLGTVDLPASTELLAYYRTRIQDFEKERNEFIEVS